MSDNNNKTLECDEYQDDNFDCDIIDAEYENLSYAERRKAEVAPEGQHKKEQIRAKRKAQKKLQKRVNRENARRKGKPNVTKICEEMGYSPVETLMYIAMGDKEALGTDEDIRIFERRSAAQTLMPYYTAPFKAKEYVDDTSELEEIPLFLGPRSVPSIDTPKLGVDTPDVEDEVEEGDEDAPN